MKELLLSCTKKSAGIQFGLYLVQFGVYLVQFGLCLGTMSVLFGYKLGYIWTHFGLYLDTIWNVFGLYLGCIWDIYGFYLGTIWVVFGLYSGFILVIFRFYLGTVWVVCELYSGFIWVVFGLYLSTIWVVFVSLGVFTCFKTPPNPLMGAATLDPREQQEGTQGKGRIFIFPGFLHCSPLEREDHEVIKSKGMADLTWIFSMESSPALPRVRSCSVCGFSMDHELCWSSQHGPDLIERRSGAQESIVCT